MTQTWKLMAVGATAAAALALAIGTASARAAKVIIIRDGSLKLTSVGARVEPKPPDRFKHRTDMMATEVTAYRGPDKGNCTTEVTSRQLQPPNVVQLQVRVENGPTVLLIDGANHNEPGSPGRVFGLAFGKGWRFEPQNDWSLTDPSGQVQFQIERVLLYQNPNDTSPTTLVEARDGEYLCVSFEDGRPSRRAR